MFTGVCHLGHGGVRRFTRSRQKANIKCAHAEAKRFGEKQITVFLLLIQDNAARKTVQCLQLAVFLDVVSIMTYRYIQGQSQDTECDRKDRGKKRNERILQISKGSKKTVNPGQDTVLVKDLLENSGTK
eukprot:Seg132.1 transcript_id=Seg132.1/GoldUCD/mRNA.D3Y31 product="hypothetical protein" protein_id=Seg132.1/GoldUCD/D3Y31